MKTLKEKFGELSAKIKASGQPARGMVSAVYTGFIIKCGKLVGGIGCM